MSVLILTHPLSHRHVTPPGHPERVARIQAIDAVLERPDYADLPRAEAPEATQEQLLRAHDPHYLQELEAVSPEHGWASIDADTQMSPDSLAAARHAAGANIAAVDAVLSGAHTSAVCAVRPCGHHAERERAMGFCFYGNIAIGAAHALEAHGLERVAIIDFDVHHGNGTQDIFWAEKRILFASTHQLPLFPGTGHAHETGIGNIINCPLAPRTGGREMRAAFDGTILPALDSFRPELIMISAGFDAHRDDPLANLNWTDEDFFWLTAAIAERARALCGGRIVSSLEGGYDLDGLASGFAAHLDALIASAEAP